MTFGVSECGYINAAVNYGGDQGHVSAKIYSRSYVVRLDIIVDVWRVNNSVYSDRTMSKSTAMYGTHIVMYCVYSYVVIGAIFNVYHDHQMHVRRCRFDVFDVEYLDQY
ncbi:hypothetical protein BATDEDRAFT_28732 [Batrachochytrium dendrobatidis JAM81]|uniref:Uncharacterized protein n=1 Tax=Batrachochytrium dendrobatidis (strain JAM81 / FGSC 10211) TaxID=684364 RepID=F4PEY8_BATDJ|nr:uncharacterized protein BATDEDRAFT_28732 [Batrachochytrium dendrobatidis JAM81]EGF76209.1 hypothetical protein BATDEDRAFT_28732 [Batrachochytrium dendrobatidis JAM81]|eukprot:XP_006683168.1 hypothetical protein BATDEDRAFT_28732 [Batrachochytrium dendrobatidis JAM81]